jgi:hypothetical protein
VLCVVTRVERISRGIEQKRNVKLFKSTKEAVAHFYLLLSRAVATYKGKHAFKVIYREMFLQSFILYCNTFLKRRERNRIDHLGETHVPHPSATELYTRINS